MTQLAGPYTGLSRLKLFWALSRTPHGLLDMATPALGALLWLGRFPSLEVIVIGLVTTFAGYTAVYALNDVIDYRVDREKIRICGTLDAGCDLDALMVRHPMAQGYLSFREGLLWSAAWSMLALVGAYRLNPVCIIIFLMGCLLETIYCKLLRITHLRTLISGGVKTMGAIAGVFAVDPKPSPLFLIVLFLWLFFWEIGGQNVPNDWTDIEADRHMSAKTIPVQLGTGRASGIILGSVIIAVILSMAVLSLSPLAFEFPFIVGVVAFGLCLYVLPAALLFNTGEPHYAMALFNMASYYPFSILIIVVAKLAI